MSRRADAVFEGGGMKAIGLVGALAVAEARGYRWVNVAGTSAGAIVASLVAAGYRARELKQIVMGMDYLSLRDAPWYGHIPAVGPVMSLLVNKGLYLGDALEEWLREHLQRKGVRTFADLVIPKEKDARFRFRLQVIAADVTRGRMLVLPEDIRRYGRDPESLDVARAVRMSASLPYFYQPVRLRPDGNHGKGNESYIVDGGLLSNFPVWLFDVPGHPPWPTFGFRFVEPNAGRPRRIWGPITLGAALVATMLEAHDARHTAQADFARTVAIPTLGVNTTDFDLTQEGLQALFEAGSAAAQAFFDQWNFAAYVARHRIRPGTRAR